MAANTLYNSANLAPKMDAMIGIPKITVLIHVVPVDREGSSKHPSNTTRFQRKQAPLCHTTRCAKGQRCQRRHSAQRTDPVLKKEADWIPQSIDNTQTTLNKHHNDGQGANCTVQRDNITHV